MNFRKFLWLVCLSLLAGILSACNIGTSSAPAQDTGAIQTAAIELVLTQSAMQQTQTAMAIPPTPMPTNTSLPAPTLGGFATFASAGTPLGAGTPFAFNTPLPGFTPLASPVPTQAGDACLSLTFMGDVTIPDGTVMKPGRNFEKSWLVMNTGTCTWDDGFVLVYQGGSLDGYNIPIKKSSDFVGPGEKQTYKVNLTSSIAEREYIECWRMRDDGGWYFGSFLCVDIIVQK
jgi:hypothetical protein